MNDELKLFWCQFCQKHNLNVNTKVDSYAFGRTEKEADNLANLVNKGIKTATSSAYELYAKAEKLPQVGEYSIILNSKNKPVCVVKEVSVEIIPYNLISPKYAYLEGEGDRSYSYWRKIHDKFFRQEYELAGKTFYLQAPIVCEIFEKID